jgi:hypothetical protein
MLDLSDNLFLIRNLMCRILITHSATICSQSLHPRDREPVQRMFPKTYGQPLLQVEAAFDNTSSSSTNGAAARVGLVFCGRQVSFK